MFILDAEDVVETATDLDSAHCCLINSELVLPSVETPRPVIKGESCHGRCWGRSWGGVRGCWGGLADAADRSPRQDGQL